MLSAAIMRDQSRVVHVDWRRQRRQRRPATGAVANEGENGGLSRGSCRRRPDYIRSFERHANLKRRPSQADITASIIVASETERRPSSRAYLVVQARCRGHMAKTGSRLDAEGRIRAHRAACHGSIGPKRHGALCMLLSSHVLSMTRCQVTRVSTVVLHCA